MSNNEASNHHETFATMINKDKASENHETFARMMESLMHITLAGFGGALAGLSIARRRGSVAAQATTMARTAAGAGRAKEKKTMYVDNDLPVTWAVTCLTFAGIFEFTRLMSPTSLMMNGYKMLTLEEEGSSSDDEDDDDPSSTTKLVEQENTNDAITHNQNGIGVVTERPSAAYRYMQSAGDYTIGGGIAGAFFKGATIRTKAGKRLMSTGIGKRFTPPITAASTGIIAGLVPGAALGFIAGSIIFGIDELQYFAEDQLSDKEDGGDGYLEEDGDVQKAQDMDPSSADR